jgi:hypothetical protein
VVLTHPSNWPTTTPQSEFTRKAFALAESIDNACDEDARELRAYRSALLAEWRKRFPRAT